MPITAATVSTYRVGFVPELAESFLRNLRFLRARPGEEANPALSRQLVLVLAFSASSSASLRLRVRSTPALFGSGLAGLGSGFAGRIRTGGIRGVGGQFGRLVQSRRRDEDQASLGRRIQQPKRSAVQLIQPEDGAHRNQRRRLQLKQPCSCPCSEWERSLYSA